MEIDHSIPSLLKISEKAKRRIASVEGNSWCSRNLPVCGMEPRDSRPHEGNPSAPSDCHSERQQPRVPRGGSQPEMLAAGGRRQTAEQEEEELTDRRSSTRMENEGQTQLSSRSILCRSDPSSMRPRIGNKNNKDPNQEQRRVLEKRSNLYGRTGKLQLLSGIVQPGAARQER